MCRVFDREWAFAEVRISRYAVKRTCQVANTGGRAVCDKAKDSIGQRLAKAFRQRAQEFQPFRGGGRVKLSDQSSLQPGTEAGGQPGNGFGMRLTRHNESGADRLEDIEDVEKLLLGGSAGGQKR